MKYLIVLLVVAVGLWLWTGGRKRGSKERQGPAAAAPPKPAPGPKAAPVVMITCAHCGVHLPADDALRDAAGRGFCSEAHRLAGPR